MERRVQEQGRGRELESDQYRAARLYIQALLIDPHSSDTLYAGTADVVHEAGGVLKSTNGGKTGTQLDAGLPAGTVFALAIDPTAPGTLYAGTYGHGVYRSSNGGRWHAVNRGLKDKWILALAINPATGTLYAGTMGDGVFVMRQGE